MKSLRLRILAQTLPFLLIAPVALAQAPAKAPSRGQATAALNQPANPGAAHYTRQQIDQLVAPIALYPDQVLSQVLMAATYPQQVVEAAQWLKEQGHGDLQGDALAQALEPLPWDPSVKALVAFPQIIEMMNEHIEWTQALGVAFATQQAEVMSRVQVLRQLAMKSGKLKQVRHLTVRQEGPVIVITSAEPDRVYVPIYNPTVVYGQWTDREFPPVYLPPPQGFAVETIEPGFDVSTGYSIVRPLWGWSEPDWRTNRITVNSVEYSRITRGAPIGPGNVWRHNGPVVLVAPTGASRTTVTTTNIPAGAVAPARAAAVVTLPQRAAAQPNLIQTQTTTTQTPSKPGQTSTTTTQPTTTQPGQTTPTTMAQPTTTPPRQTTPTRTAQPSTTPSGQASTATAPPTTTQPDKTPTTTAQPSKTPAASTAQPGQAAGKSAQRSKEQAGASHPGGGETEKKQPTTDEKMARPSAQPNKTEASKTEAPAEHKAGGAHTRPGEAAKNQGTTPPTAGEPRERVPAPAATKAPEPAAPRGPEHAGAKPPAGTPEQPARAPEHAGAKPPAASEQPSRAPEHAGAKSPAGPTPPGGGPAAGQEPQRTNAPPASGQGTSTPPQPGPHQAGPGAQRPHEPGARPPGQPPEQGEKKER
jgi:hypothetical protein